MVRDLRGLTDEEVKAYFSKEEPKKEGITFKGALEGIGDFISSAWAAGVNRAGTTYDWMVDNNPDGVGYGFDYNTALQLQDRKRELERVDPSTLDSKGLIKLQEERDAIASNFKALLTDGSAYNEKEMDTFLNRYRESFGYELLKNQQEKLANKPVSKQQVLEKINFQELRSDIYSQLDFKQHTVTKSDGTTIQYNAHDLPLIMDTVIEAHRRNFESAMKVYSSLEAKQDLSDDEVSLKEEAKQHVDKLKKYMVDYINNLETSTSLGSAEFASKWAKDNDTTTPFSVKNEIGFQSNTEVYFERQLNRIRRQEDPFSITNNLEAVSNLAYEIGDNLMTSLKVGGHLLTGKGFNKSLDLATTMHDASQVSDADDILKKEKNFLNTMSNWILDAGPDIAVFWAENILVTKGAGLAAKAISYTKLAKGFQTASKVLRNMEKYNPAQLTKAVVSLEATSANARALNSMTAFIVRETIENFGAQMAISGGTMEDYNATDLAMDVAFSVIFGGAGLFSEMKTARALLEQDKAIFRGELAKKIFNIEDSLWHQVDDQTKMMLGDGVLTLIKNDTVSPRVNELVAKAKQTYENIDDFVSQVKVASEKRLQDVYEYASTQKKFQHLLEKTPEGIRKLAKDVPSNAYIELTDAFLRKEVLEELGERSRTAYAISQYYLNQELPLWERLKKARDAFFKFTNEQKLKDAEARKASIELNPVNRAIFEKWLKATDRKYPETNDEWFNTLQEFALEHKRFTAEYLAEGNEFMDAVKANNSTPLKFEDRNLVNDTAVSTRFDRVAQGMKKFTDTSYGHSKVQIFHFLKQGYDFAVQFLPGLEVNGKEYFEAVMNSDIHAAAKFVALDPLKDISNFSREANKITVRSPQLRYFSNPVELAYFLGREGKVKIGDETYDYVVDSLTYNVIVKDKDLLLDLLSIKPDLPLDADTTLIFIKSEAEQIQKTLEVNNGLMSIFSSDIKFSEAQALNGDLVKLSKQQYNYIKNSPHDPVTKAKIAEELINNPPKFSEMKGNNKGLYMERGDFGFDNIETMRMYWGDYGKVSLRGFGDTAKWGIAEEFYYHWNPEYNGYLLKVIEDNKAVTVGLATNKEIVLKTGSKPLTFETFDGDVALNNTLVSYGKSRDLLKKFFNTEKLHTPATIFKEMTGKDLPKNLEETKSIIEEYANEVFFSGLEHSFTFDQIMELIALPEKDLELFIQAYERFEIHNLPTEAQKTKFFKGFVTAFTKNPKELLKFLETFDSYFGGDKINGIIEYIKQTSKITLPIKGKAPDYSELLHTIHKKFGLNLPEELFKKGGPLADEDVVKKLNTLLLVDPDGIFHLLKSYLQGYEEVFDRAIIEYTALSAELGELIKNSKRKGQPSAISKEYSSMLAEVNQIIGDLTKVREFIAYVPPKDEVKEVIEKIKPDSLKSSSVADDIAKLFKEKKKPVIEPLLEVKDESLPEEKIVEEVTSQGDIDFEAFYKNLNLSDKDKRYILLRKKTEELGIPEEYAEKVRERILQEGREKEALQQAPQFQPQTEVKIEQQPETKQEAPIEEVSEQEAISFEESLTKLAQEKFEEVLKREEAEVIENITKDLDGLGYYDKRDVYVKGLDSIISERSLAPDVDIKQGDITRELAYENKTQVPWYKNKTILDPNKHFTPDDFAYNQESIVNDAPNIAGIEQTIASIKNSITIVGRGSYDKLRGIFEKNLKTNIYDLDSKTNNSRRKQQRSVMDYMRISIELFLNGAKPDNLFLPFKIVNNAKVIDKRSLAEMYMRTRGPLKKGVVNLGMTQSLVGTYWFHQLSEAMADGIGYKFGDREKGDFHKYIRDRLFKEIFIFEILPNPNPQNIKKVHAYMKFFSTLYETLPKEMKEGRVRRTSGVPRLSLEAINRNLFNDSIKKLEYNGFLTPGELFGIEISPSEYNYIMEFLNDPKFDVIDINTLLWMKELAHENSVLGILSREADNFGVYVRDVVPTKDFVMVPDAEEGLYKKMDERGYEPIVFHGRTAQIMAPFGLIFRKKIENVENVNILDKVVDSKKTEDLPTVDYNKMPVNEDNNKILIPTKPLSEIKTGLLKSYNKKKEALEKINNKHGDYHEDKLKMDIFNAAANIIDENGNLIEENFIQFIHDYGSIKPTDVGFSLQDDKIFKHPAGDYFTRKLIEDSTSELRAQYLGDDNYKAYTKPKVLFVEGMRSNIPAESFAKEVARYNKTFEEMLILAGEDVVAEGKKKAQETLKAIEEGGLQGPYVDQLRRQAEATLKTLDKVVNKYFLPTTNRAALDRNIAELKEIHKQSTYLDTSYIEDEHVQNPNGFLLSDNNPINLNDPNAIIITSHPQSVEAYKRIAFYLQQNGFEIMQDKTIKGVFMNMNGIYRKKTDEAKKATIAQEKEKTTNLIDSGKNFIHPCSP